MFSPGGPTYADGPPPPARVYQCDRCVVEVDFLGERTAAALTFTVGPDGRPHDPADA